MRATHALKALRSLGALGRGADGAGLCIGLHGEIGSVRESMERAVSAAVLPALAELLVEAPCGWHLKVFCVRRILPQVHLRLDDRVSQARQGRP